MLELLERPMADETGDVMTTDEVARELGVSRATVLRFVERNKLTPLPSNPLLDRPRRLLFKREDVERLKRA